MIASLRLYSTPLALFIWAGVWALGFHGDAVIGAGLFMLGATTVIAEQERARRRRESR